MSAIWPMLTFCGFVFLSSAAMLSLILGAATLVRAAVRVPGALAQWRDDERGRCGRCVRCNDDLTGNESGRCPECGTAVKP